MAAEDFTNLTSDQGLPSDLDGGSAYTGNRPASGARRATPGEVLSQGFQGAENAGDFLGLDVEFAGSQGDPSLDLQAPPGIQSPEDATSYDPAPLPAGDPVQEFAEAPSAFEFGEDLGTEEGEEAFEGHAHASRRPLLVGALLAIALGVGGMLYGPELYHRYAGGSGTVATVPETAIKTADGVKPAKSAPGEPAPSKTDVATSVPTASGVSPSAATTPEKSTPTKVATRTPGANRPSTPVAQPDATPVASNPAPTDAQDATPGDVLTNLLSGAGAAPSPDGFPDLGGEAYDWTSADRLELIYRGNAVPMEAVKSPVKTLMPRVGQVRVFTTAGDVFEGRLYAVGQNRVWLDTAPGRVGLDGAMVAQIEVLPPAPAGQQQTGKAAPAGGKRVRVRVPGGMLYGRILKQEGEDVILNLDDGSGKVRVKAGDIEDLGSRRAVVVSR